MQIIKKSVEAVYSCIDFKDAIDLLDLMNEIVDRVNSARKSVANGHDWAKGELAQYEKQYNILHSLGFEAAIDLIEYKKEETDEGPKEKPNALAC